MTAKKSKPKDFRLKEAKPANGKSSALSRFDEAVKLNYQKKKEYQKKKQDWKNSSPATGDNAIQDNGKKKKSDGNCYNCLKKEYFAKNCLKPLKNKYKSQQSAC